MDAVKKFCRKYFIDATCAMAVGYFISAFTLGLIELLSRINFLSFLSFISSVDASRILIGGAVGASVAWALRSSSIVTISSVIVGIIGFSYGGLLGAYLAVAVGAGIASLISTKTKLDLIITPLLTVIAGGLVGVYSAPHIDKLAVSIASLIHSAEGLHPVLSGIVISVISSVLTVLPILPEQVFSVYGLTAVSAGTAAVGASCMAIGLAVSGFKDTDIGDALAVGFGTAKLQFHNILLHPQIIIAPILSSAILGPVSSCVLEMTNTAAGASSCTCLIGAQLAAYDSMAERLGGAVAIVEIAVMHFILPAVLTLMFDFAGRRLNIIKSGQFRFASRTSAAK